MEKTGSRSLFFRSDLHMCLGGRGEMRDAGFEDRRCSVGRWRECVTFLTRLTLLE
jgi:hypothetical protein